MQRTTIVTGLIIGAIIGVSLSAAALQVLPFEFDLHLAAGSTSSYSFLVINDESRAQEITVYLNDWVRFPPERKTYFFTLNDAYWLFPRQFAPGDVFTITYRVLPPFNGVTITGSYVTGSPAAYGKIAGPSTLAGTGSTASVATAGPVEITRAITPSPTVPGAQRVQLTVHVLKAVTGMRIDEVFSRHVTVESVAAAGGEFTTVARSDGDWITVTPQKFTIDPGKRQRVSFTVHVPRTGVSGMYWAAIMVDGLPRIIGQHNGVVIAAKEEFGIKVYVTITGTEIKSGRVTDVRVAALDPLTFTVTFENTGNVQLRPTGSITIISQRGETMRKIPIEQFPVLPGATAVVTVKDTSSKPLPPGIYLARAAIDYGGATEVGGQRAFRVK